MRLVGRLDLVVCGAGLLLAAHMARAQGSCTFTDETGKTVTWPNCQPPTDKKSAPPPTGTSPAKSFPYPGDSAVPPASSSAPTGTATPSQTGSGQTPAAPSAPAGNRFPYPGDPASNAATAGGDTKPRPPNGDPLQDAGSSGSSSSSSSSSSEGTDAGPLGADDDPAEKAAEARIAARRRASAGPRQTPDERETEDLRVAAFYQNDSNFKGAYDRAKDAVSLAKDDADAHLALAEAARRLGKLDEAEANYKKCLALDPLPKTKKTAEKALKEMSGG
jgi:hypothetical protein